MKATLVLTALAAIAIAGQAAAQAPASGNQQRNCFYGGNLNGFRAVDDQTVLLNVGVRDIYEAKLFAPSNDLKWVNGIALVSRGGGNFICSKLDAEIVVPSSTMGPQKYPVTSLRRLTPAEVAAIPKKNRP
jgi:hypothetical protein